MAESDVARLESVLALAKAHGLRLSALVVGDIKLAILGQDVEPHTKQPPSEIEQLRTASRRTFGRVLPDDTLREMHTDGLL